MPTDALAALNQLRKALQAERDEEMDQFKQILEKTPLHERVATGHSWYPVVVTKSGYTYGDRAFVIVERTTHLDVKDHFRSGNSVSFFTQDANAKGKRERSGVINYANKQRMKIILAAKDLPDWIGTGRCGVDLMFDDTSYQEMDRALKAVIGAKGDRLAELRDVCYGKRPAESLPVVRPLDLPQLNESQNAAVQHILASQDVEIVHGPPGTGKTTTLVEAIRLLTEQEATVLVCAPSNTAVDLLTERLDARGLNVVRVGNISRADESIIRLTLDEQLARHPEAKNIKKVKHEAAETRRKAQRYRRSYGREEARERAHLYRQAGELEGWARQLETRLIDQLLSGAQVITCTLVSSANKILADRKFKTVVIDEAAQALEPATWIPILKSRKVVLAGDPFQLPPTVKSRKAERMGLNVTLLEKLIATQPDVNLLTVQYRMHNAIMGFSNQWFYDGKLRAADAVAEHGLDVPRDHSVEFIDTAGAGFDEKLNREFQSRYNPEEFQILTEHLYELVEQHTAAELPVPSIALISPYREQVIRMREAVNEDPKLADLPIVTKTVDGFQGQERDVVYLSLVRSNAKGEIGFLKDYRRMNVAMTRARKLLVVVGDSATIGADAFYQAFLEYVDKTGGYRTAWEYLR